MRSNLTLIDRSRNCSERCRSTKCGAGTAATFSCIDFAGDLSALDLQALERVARVVGGAETGGPVADDAAPVAFADSVRSALSLLNERVEIRGFEEIIPSMNDIFIRAVGGEL